MIALELGEVKARGLKVAIEPVRQFDVGLRQ